DPPTTVRRRTMHRQTRTRFRELLALVGVVSLMAIPAPRLARADDWKPFLVDKKGKQSEFPSKPQEVNDKEWLGVQYSEYAGYKPRVAVVYQNEKVESPELTNQWAKLILMLGNKQQQETNPFNHIEDLVSTALVDTHRLNMLERTTALADV